MAKNDCYDYLLSNLDGITVKKDYNVKQLTRYKTGGTVDLYIEPNTTQQMAKAIEVIKGICPYFVVGGGNNLLISDSGYRGAIIHTKNLNKKEIKGNLYIAECGVKIQSIIEDNYLNSLGGLEFAVGIPSTVGGAVCMNAGCYGKSVGDLVCYVITESGIISKNDCDFSYRSSRFLKGEDAILKVCFSLKPSEPDVIEEKLSAYKSFRKNPKGRSCGSVFRNDGFYAGKVIDECGLKGLTLGGAKVSSEHANFIIANGKCTSQDIYNLIQTVKQKVYEKRGIKLVEELVYLGDFNDFNG